MRGFIISILCFVSFLAYGQKEKSTALGETTIEELKMQVYEKDATASAVVLYEHGDFYLKEFYNLLIKTHDGFVE